MDELYKFRDHFVEKFGIDKAGEKNKLVDEKLRQVIQRLDDAPGYLL